MKGKLIPLVFALLLCFVMSAAAQDYPTKPVKVIVPFTEGSATDVIARMVGKKLSEMWGQVVTIENRPGAGGSVGAGEVAKAPPDGYTLMVNSSSQAINFAFYAKLPYAPGDFADIAPLASQQMVLFAGVSSDLKDIQGLIKAAKAAPGSLKFGSPGIGSTAHLAAEQFNSMAGIRAVHVPYPGGPETIAAATDGTAAYAVLPLSIVAKGVREGKLRALGVTGSTRSADLPDVPTIAESGLAGYDATVWFGVWAPAGISRAVEDRVAKDVASALDAPEIVEQFKKKGFERMRMTQAEFSRFVQGNRETAARTLKEAGIQPK